MKVKMEREVKQNADRESSLSKQQPAVGTSAADARWEYRSELLGNAEDLSRFGNEGWELVSVLPQRQDFSVFYFKRRVS